MIVSEYSTSLSQSRPCTANSTGKPREAVKPRCDRSWIETFKPSFLSASRVTDISSCCDSSWPASGSMPRSPFGFMLMKALVRFDCPPVPNPPTATM